MKHSRIRAAGCAAVLTVLSVQNPVYAASDVQQLVPILESIVTADMTGVEKLTAITKYTAENYAYTAEHTRYQHWYEMIEYGGGDCWANTDMIVNLCTLAEIRVIRHDSSLGIAGSGSGHINTVAEIDGEYYLAEAGFSGEKPRMYQVTKIGSRPYTVTEKEGTAGFRRYYGFETAFSIPKEADGLPVTSIGSYAFSTKQLTDYSRNNSKLCYQFWKWDFSRVTAVEIPDTVTVIQPAAFMCSKLTAVTVPKSVTVLPKNTFYYSEDLAAVRLPASLTEIGENAFGDCGALTDIWFAGTQAQWDAVQIADGNDPLRRAVLHTADSVLTGDLDKDGVLSAADAALLRDMLTGSADASEEADINGDKQLDARDLTLLKQQILSTVPAGSDRKTSA